MEAFEDVYVSDDSWSDEEGEVTYEDICDAVKAHASLSKIRKLLDDYQVQKFNDMEELDLMTDDLWYNVMIPCIDNSCGFVDKTKLEVRHAFSKWLYENSNIGRRIAYILKLGDSPGRVPEPGVGDDIVAGDEGQGGKPNGL